VAQFIVGLLFREGVEREQDHEAAAVWLRRAADQGFAASQHMLGLQYLEGKGNATTRLLQRGSGRWQTKDMHRMSRAYFNTALGGQRNVDLGSMMYQSGACRLHVISTRPSGGGPMPIACHPSC
jgi:TPR repeat protein